MKTSLLSYCLTVFIAAVMVTCLAAIAVAPMIDLFGAIGRALVSVSGQVG
jgi:hypothetical protein